MVTWISTISWGSCSQTWDSQWTPRGGGCLPRRAPTCRPCTMGGAGGLAALTISAATPISPGEVAILTLSTRASRPALISARGRTITSCTTDAQTDATAGRPLQAGGRGLRTRTTNSMTSGSAQRTNARRAVEPSSSAMASAMRGATMRLAISTVGTAHCRAHRAAASASPEMASAMKPATTKPARLITMTALIPAVIVSYQPRSAT
mmetsp:Transcript_38970/g.99665  ORF Transcript_38970/g.99665 Transcript_38970/m.99665 type:complete len:207 (-) Transcript_38970:170-790(-)